MTNLSQYQPALPKQYSQSITYTDTSKPDSPTVKTLSFLFEMNESVLNIFMLKTVKLSLKNPDTNLFERGGKMESVIPDKIATGKVVGGKLELSAESYKADYHTSLPGYLKLPNGEIIESPKVSEIVSNIVYFSEPFAESYPALQVVENIKALPATTDEQ